MLTQAEISRDWGTSREYVRQCVKKGCPLDSFENARFWRESQTGKRPSTSPVQIARQLENETDDDSPEARKRRREFYKDRPEGTALPSSSMDVALHNSQRAADEAFRLLQESMMEGRDTKIGTRLSVHSKAVEARIKTEIAHREELERRRILVPLSEAEDMARKGFDIILSRLSSLPQNIAPRCNPHDPHHAMDILQSECAGIIADAQKAFA